jgi:hypothetical protein
MGYVKKVEKLSLRIKILIRGFQRNFSCTKLLVSCPLKASSTRSQIFIRSESQDCSFFPKKEDIRIPFSGWGERQTSELSIRSA